MHLCRMRPLAQFAVAGLFLALALPFTGTWCWLAFEAEAVREGNAEMFEEGVAAEDLVLFSLTSDEIQALEWKHDAEFRLNGKMYDVLRREVSDDCVRLWCWLDGEESELRREMDIVLGRLGSHQDTGDQKLLLTDFFKNLWVTTGAYPAAPGKHSAGSTVATDNYPSGRYKGAPPTPPPNLC